MPLNKTSKMLNYINQRVKVSTIDGRNLVGTFLAFDRHMNLVLSHTEEFRIVKSKGKRKDLVGEEEKRTLGLILLRGENVVSIQQHGLKNQTGSTSKRTRTGTSQAVGTSVLAQAQPGLGRAKIAAPPSGSLFT